ncbi:helix-turn-helix transcriptional regulator [Stappia sediminis]|nr:AraC family transcriptional regulator [Stappia sediminis]
MESIPLTRSAFVLPFTNVLNEAGAPTVALLSEFHLPTHLEDKSDCYLPLFPVLRFVSTAELSQGIRDIGFLAGRRLSFETLTGQSRALVLHSPTLFVALKNVCRFARVEDSSLRVRLIRHEGDLRICYTNIAPRADHMPHLEHAQWIQNLMTIYIIRQFAGPDWAPATFAFQSLYTPHAETLSRWPRTRFLRGEKTTWLDIPLEQLSLPIRARCRAPRRSADRVQPIDTDFISTFKLMLATYLDEHVPTIAEAAEILGTSVRSLQRELSHAGLTYTRLLDHIRFEKSARMLRETDAKIIDVAYAAGYASPSHFSRAFHRIAGVTPREFRGKTAHAG